MKCTAILICGVVAGSMPLAMAEAADAPQIELMWSTVIPGGYEGAQDTVVDFTHASTGGLALYGQHTSSSTKVQVLGGKTIDWVSVNPSGDAYRIAATSDDSFFLAGSVQQTHGWFSFEKSPSDAYLAHFSSSGDLLWERSLGEVGFQVATDVAALPNGGAVVSVLNHRSVELWAVNPQGETLWQKPIGVQDAAIAVTSSGSTIVAVTMDNAGRDSHGSNYAEDLVLSLHDITGNELSRTVVRPDLNRFAGAHFLKVSVDVSDEAILIASSWRHYNRNSGDYQPLEIAAYDHAGALKWLHRPVIENCDAPPFFLPNGEAIIACAEPYDDSPRHLVINRFGLVGEVTELRALLPECHQNRYPGAIQVVEVIQQMVTLLASRPSGNIAASCSWVGTVDFKP